jgi:hypothetical protein
MNSYDLDTKEGWLYAAGLAGSLGWRHGKDFENKLNTEELMQALYLNAKLLNIRVGHKQNLRSAYGSAYWAARVVAQDRARAEGIKI